jgi:hypothetical protein
VLEPAGPSAPTLRLESEPHAVAAHPVTFPAPPEAPALEPARPALSGASPTTAVPRTAQRRSPGITRRLVVLCIVGAAAGSVAAWLWTRTSEEPAPAGDGVWTGEGARTGLVAAAPPDAAIPAEPLDANEIDRNTVESRDANEAIATTEIEIAPDPAPGNPVPGDAAPAAHKPSRATRPRTSSTSLPADAAPPSPVVTDGNLGAATSPKEPASPAAGSGETRQQASRSPDRPSPDKLTALFQKEQYATVVRMCSETEMTSSIATVCVLAACYARASDKARSWLPVISRERQAAMAARCEQLGVLQRPTGTGSATATGSGSQ